MASVRDAGANDSEALADLHYEITRHAYRGFFPSDRRPPTYEELMQDWVETLSEPDVDVLIAEEGGIVGSAVLRGDATDRTLGVVKRVHVRPSSWRRGVGTLLFDQVMHRAEQRGFLGLSLWVIEDNERARKFFEAYGWASVPGSKEFLPSQGNAEVEYRLRIGR